jgi:hypothetical protein
MLLSELVKLKIELLQYANINSVKDAANKVEDNIRALRSVGAGVEYDKHLTDVTKIITRHLTQLEKEKQDKVAQIIESIDYKIQELSVEYFAKGYEYFDATVEDDRDEQSGRKLPLPDHIREVILGRIRLYSDWHYPGMEIGPHDGEFTSHLVACDPLYLVDVHREYLDSTMSQFTLEFQNRIRPYLINVDQGLSTLPQNQFCFIFSWNTFNYLPLDYIKEYLFDVFGLLRPGGTFLFSYNDGETYNGARHVEWGGMSYMPKSLLVAVAEGHGFEVTTSFGFETDWHNISWLEIKKPGTLSTVKAHQTLGIIKDIEQ